MKIRLVGAEWSMRKDGRTDLTKLTVALRNFVNTPIKYFSSPARPDESEAHPDAYPSNGTDFLGNKAVAT